MQIERGSRGNIERIQEPAFFSSPLRRLHRTSHWFPAEATALLQVVWMVTLVCHTHTAANPGPACRTALEYAVCVCDDAHCHCNRRWGPLRCGSD